MRHLFLKSEDVDARDLDGFFPGTAKPTSARETALGILSLAQLEGVDPHALARYVGPLEASGDLPEGTIKDSVDILAPQVGETEALVSLALFVVLHKNQVVYRDLRHALEVGDHRLLTQVMEGLVSS